MSKKTFEIDTPSPGTSKQRTFDDISRRVDNLLIQKDDIEQAIINRRYRPKTQQEYFDEDCVELAAAVKSTIRQTGISRPEMVDAINKHYGWPTTDEVDAMDVRPEDHLSLHMFNHYLSKPTEYRMPGGLLFAICRITGSLEPCRVIASAGGGDVVEQNEKNELLAGKAKKLNVEAKKLIRMIEKDW